MASLSCYIKFELLLQTFCMPHYISRRRKVASKLQLSNGNEREIELQLYFLSLSSLRMVASEGMKRKLNEKRDSLKEGNMIIVDR